jgi:hypothetical protein
MITQGLGIGVDHPDYEPMRASFMDVYSQCLADNTRFWPGMDRVVNARE